MALIVTPQGFPLAYEVMDGNTADCTTLTAFVDKIQTQYGRAERIWVMDRGIPTEEALAQLRAERSAGALSGGHAEGAIDYPGAGLPGRALGRRRASRCRSNCSNAKARCTCWPRATGRVDKERAMRRRSLRKLLKRLKELQQQTLTRDALLMKLGAAKKEAGRAYA